MKCPLETGEHAELLAYCSQKLEGSSAAALERHMLSCSACRDFATAQRAVWQALDAWDAPAVSAGFDRDLYRAIEHERAHQECGWWSRWLTPQPLLVRRGIPIAAAACLLVAAGLMLENPSGTPKPQPENVQVENLQPDQVQHAFDDMEMLSNFSRAARTDGGEL